MAKVKPNKWDRAWSVKLGDHYVVPSTRAREEFCWAWSEKPVWVPRTRALELRELLFFFRKENTHSKDGWQAKDAKIVYKKVSDYE